MPGIRLRLGCASQADHDQGVTGLFLVGVVAFGLFLYGIATGQIPKTPERAANRWYELDAPLLCKRMLIKTIASPNSYQQTSGPITSEDTGSRKVIQWNYSLKESSPSQQTARCVINKTERSTALVKAQ